jgi:hypothetical protein
VSKSTSSRTGASSYRSLKSLCSSFAITPV